MNITLAITRPHVAKVVKEILEALQWNVLPHPPYSPDIAPSDYHMFRSMTHGLAEQHFTSYQEAKNWVDVWIASKDEEFFSTRNPKLQRPVFWSLRYSLHQADEDNAYLQATTPNKSQRLALHVLPHLDHPASAGPSCPACGSSDGCLGHRYWSCPHIRPLVREAFQVVGRPPDLQAWIFGIDLVDDELAILASAKSRINQYFIQVGLGQAIEDPVIVWRRTLSRIIAQPYSSIGYISNNCIVIVNEQFLIFMNITIAITRPHVAKVVKETLEALQWDVLHHPPYSPDIAPSDYHMFRSMTHGLAEQHFTSYEEAKNWVNVWIASKDKEFFSTRNPYAA
ncbi:hypothetical protein LAZ67_20000057 [Cordylochernes scorpioides]|uniref:Mariner Mos1 transposase n=1 Tax=Cordylochernes scorpioides TaxID=51811 RepID=A0ABY6LJ03_9ARAC|nr:hypothetical protein LAZ67_20000057 [Cordylochernes scorpioides]